MSNEIMIRMEQIVKTYYIGQPNELEILHGINLDVKRGEFVSIVGESGSGKSVMSQSILRLREYDSAVKYEGEILFEGKNILQLSQSEMRTIRGNRISVIFQDPMTSLSPVHTVGKQLSEVLILHKKMSKQQAKERCLELLSLTGIPNPENCFKQYPYELSGGMQQRVMIAMALSCEPKLLIADEPTTALDVTIQAQIIDLIKQLQQKLGTSVILITHDLGVVADIAHRIVVMYSGKVVEQGSSEDIFYRPKHPYTWALLKAVPRLDLQNKQQLVSIEGMPPDLITPPVGCPFAERCPHTMKICQTTPPPTYHFEDGHEASCWLHHPQCRKENLPFVAGGGQECQE